METEVNNGIKAFLVLGFYFLALEVLELSHSTFLRFFNAVIVGYFMNLSVRSRVYEGRGFLAVFGSALFTNFFAVIFSTIGIAMYIKFVRGVEYIEMLAQPVFAEGGFILNTSQFTFSIFAEGFASGIVLSFGLMQYWKNKTVSTSAA